MLTANPIPYQTITLDTGKKLTIKCLHQIHPTVSGNKFFKLKYNLQYAKQHHHRILSFGGAYSNHILALAHAAHDANLASVGMIRGDELQYKPLNPVLAKAQQLGMQLYFLSRQDYRQKHTSAFLQDLQHRFPDAYIIPEGGSNDLAIKGCEEILTSDDLLQFDVICCAVGTGGTIAGIINASHTTQKVIGFSALKGDFLAKTIQQWTNKNNWQIFSDDYFGGYARYQPQLLQYIEDIQSKYQLLLDPIYTAKAFFYLQRLIENHYFSDDSRILFIHTGGLQTFQYMDYIDIVK